MEVETTNVKSRPAKSVERLLRKIQGNSEKVTRHKREVKNADGEQEVDNGQDHGGEG